MAFCNLMYLTISDTNLKPMVTNPLATAPGGSVPYTPSSLHTAYNLPTTASTNYTVAIVDAYSDPNLESDLATYRSNFGLSACTTANGCLTIVNQSGGTSLPGADSGWAGEESLDVDMVSAICQNCNILVVEANSASTADLGAAVNEAVSLGAFAVSNSYGESEYSGEDSDCSAYFQHNNVAITASSGDGGLGVEMPAACPHVVGVGGTTLNSDGSETAWNTSSSEGAGGGCSAYIPAPSWQDTSVTSCSNKAVADVSAVADPATGVYVYDSYQSSGWQTVGGTSASSPIIASVFALAGDASSTTDPASLIWANYSTGLNQVDGGTYEYQAGLGTPNGISDF
jgi:subtilase family serine protease